MWRLRRQPSEAREWEAQSSYTEASEDILLSLRERRMVGATGIESVGTALQALKIKGPSDCSASVHGYWNQGVTKESDGSRRLAALLNDFTLLPVRRTRL